MRKFLLVPAAFIRGLRLFQGGVYSSNYGIRIANNVEYTEKEGSDKNSTKEVTLSF